MSILQFKNIDKLLRHHYLVTQKPSFMSNERLFYDKEKIFGKKFELTATSTAACTTISLTSERVGYLYHIWSDNNMSEDIELISRATTMAFQLVVSTDKITQSGVAVNSDLLENKIPWVSCRVNSETKYTYTRSKNMVYFVINKRNKNEEYPLNKFDISYTLDSRLTHAAITKIIDNDNDIVSGVVLPKHSFVY